MINPRITLLACLAFSPLSGLADQSNPIVAWLDEPAWAAEPADATGPLTESTPAPCRQADLDLTLGTAGAYHGRATQELLLRNTSSAPCSLPDAPAVELAQAMGWQAIETKADQVGGSALVLAPRATVGVLLGTPGACDATLREDRRVVRRLRVLAPGGGALHTDGAHVDTTCGPAALMRVDLHAPARATAPAGLGALTAELTAPRTAHAGATVDYLVTLRNPTGTPVDLSTCPSYEQVLNTDSSREAGRWRLNCAGAGGRIPAHGQVQFAMRALVPASSLASGGVKLSWQLAGGPTAGTVVPLR
ncbi:DUF4232 domain-containing protein [Ideonella sp. DXS29W]|uniref:DUF4232 domain-containing protein n=1 Tax=Ideonella lacteola TaxID=2984193 RepID=A0ABU9BXD0_9BURK